MFVVATDADVIMYPDSSPEVEEMVIVDVKSENLPPVTSANVQCQPDYQEISISSLSSGCSMCCIHLYIIYHFNSYFLQFDCVSSVLVLKSSAYPMEPSKVVF